MLELYVKPMEFYNEEFGEFVQTKGQRIQLEHSLISLSKWEAKWHKPFMSQSQNDKTNEEILDYIKCMTLTPNVDPVVYLSIAMDKQLMESINKYIQDPNTATTIKHQKGGKTKEIVTSELIYYWMIDLGIPFECQKWHLGRLLTLIEVCSIKNTPEKKMSKMDTLSQNKNLNALRRAKAKSRG